MTWKDQIAEFKKSIKVEPAEIATSNLVMGFFGSSGSGKSVTAAICAWGFCPNGIIGWIDGEGKRAGIAADVAAELASQHFKKPKADFLARVKIVNVTPPFSPLKVVAAMEYLSEQKVDVCIADVMTQAWEGDGGYLDQKADRLDKIAGDDAQARYKKQSQAAAEVKPWTHGKLVAAVNQFPGHLILNFQGKMKYNAKLNKPDEMETPIQESGLSRQALAVGRVAADAAGTGGLCWFSGPATKHTHPSLKTILPRDGERFTFEHAEKIMAWIRGATAPTQKELVTKLWGLLKPVRGNAKDWSMAETWMVTRAIIGDQEKVLEMNVDQLGLVLAKVQAELEVTTP